jgi:hypothetical protein
MSIIRVTRDNNTKEKKMKNLGTMNGWTTEPAEYTNHINNCGTEYQATIIYNEPNPNGIGLIRKERQETRRKYDTVVTKVGKYSRTTTTVCNECNCKWQSIS